MNEAEKLKKRIDEMDRLLTRIMDDIADKTCPLADVWWYDDGTTMATKIQEVLE